MKCQSVEQGSQYFWILRSIGAISGNNLLSANVWSFQAPVLRQRLFLLQTEEVSRLLIILQLEICDDESFIPILK
jgi:hypothetical protein